MNKKKIILIVLGLFAVSIWLPRLKIFYGAGRNSGGVTSSRLDSSLPQKRQKKRTAYKNWGRNPFTVTSAAGHAVNSPGGLRLGGIVYDPHDIFALINDEVAHVGDQVAGKKVVEIKPDRVILSDGSRNIELKLEE